jgi:two-component system, chemotaxis family, CheB/CheR fusion protein
MARKTKRIEKITEKSTNTEISQPVEDSTASKELNFRVVGIGASAGGLEAFEEFFSNLPPDSGMAFVIVQHLGPPGEKRHA